MIPIGALCQGMQVITPLGELARVDGIVIDTRRPDKQWLNLTYYAPRDPDAPTVTLETHLLRPYRGVPVVFADERARMQKKYSESPEAEAT